MSNAIEMIAKLAETHLAQDITEAIVNAAKPVKTPRKKVHTSESANKYAKEVAQNLMQMFGKDFGQLAEQIIDFAKSHPLEVPEKAKKPRAKKVIEPTVVTEEPVSVADNDAPTEPKKVKKPRAKKVIEPIVVTEEPKSDTDNDAPTEPKKVKKPRAKKVVEPAIIPEEPVSVVEPAIIPEETVSVVEPAIITEEPVSVVENDRPTEPKKVKKLRAKKVVEPMAATEEPKSDTDNDAPTEPKKVKKPRAKKVVEPMAATEEPKPDTDNDAPTDPKKVKKPRAKKVVEPAIIPEEPICGYATAEPYDDVPAAIEEVNETRVVLEETERITTPIMENTPDDYYEIVRKKQEDVEEYDNPEFAGFNADWKELEEEELSEIEYDD